MNNNLIGITERGDAALNTNWLPWVTDGNPAILITKSPSKLLFYLKPKDNIIVHCTITGLGGSIYEPNVCSPEIEIDAYENLCDMHGTDRVVLRIDPIIPTDDLIDKALEVYKSRRGRVRISIIDMYPHVHKRFAESNVPLPFLGFHLSLNKRKEIISKFTDCEVCGEPGIPCSGCVSELDADVLGINLKSGNKKQRTSCSCSISKYELLSNKTRCGHKCIYCYWYDERQE